MNSIDKAMMAAAGVALVFSAAAIGMTALQALATPSGTFVVSVRMIQLTGVVGLVGLAVFGVLWATRGGRETVQRESRPSV